MHIKTRFRFGLGVALAFFLAVISLSLSGGSTAEAPAFKISKSFQNFDRFSQPAAPEEEDRLKQGAIGKAPVSNPLPGPAAPQLYNSVNPPYPGSDASSRSTTQGTTNSALPYPGADRVIGPLQDSSGIHS